MTTVHLLISGSDHEGGRTVSVHASLTGASEAALSFMGERKYNHYRREQGNAEPFWRALYQPFGDDGELVPGRWEDSCDYLLIRAFPFLP